jgi:hypothetical protein
MEFAERRLRTGLRRIIEPPRNQYYATVDHRRRLFRFADEV